MTAPPTPQERRVIFAGCCEHSDLWHDGHGCLCCDCEDLRMTAADRDQCPWCRGWGHDGMDCPYTGWRTR